MADVTINFNTNNPEDVGNVFNMVRKLFETHTNTTVIIEKRDDPKDTKPEKSQTQ